MALFKFCIYWSELSERMLKYQSWAFHGLKGVVLGALAPSPRILNFVESFKGACAPFKWFIGAFLGLNPCETFPNCPIPSWKRTASCIRLNHVYSFKSLINFWRCSKVQSSPQCRRRFHMQRKIMSFYHLMQTIHMTGWKQISRLMVSWVDR